MSNIFERTHAPERGRCFVVMPFGVKDGYDHDVFFSKILLPTLKAAGLEAERLDGIYGATGLLELIVRSIQRAEILVVDLSAGSVNVGFELAMGMMYGKRCIYVAKRGTKIPTDLPNDRILWYSPTNDYLEVEAFRDQVLKQVEALLKEPSQEMALVPYVGTERVSATVTEVKPDYVTVRTADGDLTFLAGADVDYARVYDDLTKRFKIGDHLNGGFMLDLATKRSRYTLLAAEDNPWPRIASSYPLGTPFRGTVVNATSVGAFVRILGRVNGLVPSKFFPAGLPSVGKELDVVVTRLDIAARRIGLDLQHPTAASSSSGISTTLPRPGEEFDGVIEKITPFSDEGRGGFILVGLPGYNRNGLLLAKNMTASLRGDFDSGHLAKGDDVPVRVISVEDKGKGTILLRDLEDTFPPQTEEDLQALS